MRTTRIFPILVGLIIAFSSCSNKEIEGMVSEIDSAYAVVKTSEAKLLAIDTAEIGKMIRYNDAFLKYVQDNFKDTATKEQAIFFSDIIAVKRSFNKLTMQQETLVKDMIYAKAQLNDLKKDVNNGLKTRQDFDQYFSTEEKAINLFVSSVDGLVKWNESNAKRFNEMKPKIEAFKEEINKSDS